MRQWTHRDRDFNPPTVDLLYSNAWLDLHQGPVLLEIPAQSRFFVVELLDVYTHNFLNLGTRNVPAEGARYALLGPEVPASAAPAGTTAVRCPSALVWLLGRVIVDDEADLPAAHAMQAGFRVQGEPVQAPLPSQAQWQDSGDAALDFFSNLARALADFPPLPSQRAPFDLLAAANIALPSDGRLATLRAAPIEGLRAAYREGIALIQGHTHTASKAPWRFSTTGQVRQRLHAARFHRLEKASARWPRTKPSTPRPTMTNMASCCMGATRTASASRTAATCRPMRSGRSPCTAKTASWRPMGSAVMRRAAAAACRKPAVERVG